MGVHLAVGEHVLYGWPGPTGRVLWGTYVPSEPEMLGLLLLLVAVTRAFVFAGRGMVIGAVLVTLVLGSAALAAGVDRPSPHGVGYLRFSVAALPMASLAISVLWWRLMLVLPRRRIAVVEDAFAGSRGSPAAGSRDAR